MKAIPVLLIGLTSSAHAALVGHYTFDGNLDDSGTSAGEATLGNAGLLATDDPIVGSGYLSLSGSPSPDTTGNDGAVSANSFDWSTSDVRSLAFWAKATAGDIGDTNATMISLGSGTGTGNRFDVRLNGDNLRLELQGGGANTNTVVANGEWNHIAIVVPSATSTLGDVQYYFNGSLVGNFSGSTAIATGTGPLRIGDSYQDIDRDFKGGIDDVRLYDSVLSATDVQALYAIPEPSVFGFLACFGILLLIRRRR